MARKTPEPTGPAMLAQPRNRVRELIISRVELGISIRDRSINSPSDLQEAAEAASKWEEFNFEMLRRAFTTAEYGAAYRNAGYSAPITMAGFGTQPSLGKLVADFRKDVSSQLGFLESLAERLDLIDEDINVSSRAPAPRERQSTGHGRRVFIVHGRDDEIKAVVARFVERCGLEAIILHEQPDQGRTIIEKFESEADVAFAIVLLTSDDIGGLKPQNGEEPALQDRARQNVVMELGFFLGALGRNKVIALKKGDLELPSDYAGVIFTPYDAGESWKLHLARELKAAGLDVDMNAVLG